MGDKAEEEASTETAEISRQTEDNPDLIEIGDRPTTVIETQQIEIIEEEVRNGGEISRRADIHPETDIHPEIGDQDPNLGKEDLGRILRIRMLCATDHTRERRETEVRLDHLDQQADQG